MKFIKKLSKRTRIISLMILLVMVSATTIAFLQDYSSTVINSFSMKSIDTEIEENNHNTTLTKAPFVENTDITDVMVRIRLNISGDFSKFALAGIDTGYAVGSDNFNGLLAEGEENSFSQCGEYAKDEFSKQYWQPIIQDGEDHYSCYYYYKKVLKAKDDNSTLDVTQPLFDRILLKVEVNGEIQYISYNLATDDQKLEFAELENIQISLYQESVPVVLNDGDTISNADSNNNGIIDAFEETPIVEDTEHIWQYFKTNTKDAANS